MNDKKEKEDFNLVIHHYVHYDQVEFQEIKKELKEIKLLINKNHLKIMAQFSQFQAILTAIAQGIADLKTTIQNSGLTTEQEDALMAQAQAIADGITAAVPGVTQYISNANLFTDSNGDLTDEDTGTPAFISGEKYNVVILDPLTLTGIDGDHDVTDWLEPFTAVPA